MRTILGVLVLLASGACAAPTGDGTTPSPADSSRPSVAYQRDGTVWVRPTDHGAALDVGARVDGEPQHPDWSPDGSRLVVEADFTVIWTFAADGSDARRLYECTGRCVAVQDAAWSPDGGAIAFVEARTRDGEHTSSTLLRVLDLSTGRTRTVLANRTGRVWIFGPRWSDGGDGLVFEEDVFASTRLDETVVRRARVVTVRADGRRRRVLVSRRGPIVGPGSPSPDWSGQQVVFVRDDNLVLVDLRDGSRRRLTSYDGSGEHAIQPTFGADGRSIAFTYVRGSFGVDDRPEGAVTDPRTGTVTMLGLPGATHVRLEPS